MSSEKIINLNSNNFSEALASDKPTLIDFWAPWCGPCKAIGPILDELAEELGEQVQICKVDVDSNTALAAEYGVNSIPTLLFFKNGKQVKQHVGLANKNEIKETLLSL